MEFDVQADRAAALGLTPERHRELRNVFDVQSCVFASEIAPIIARLYPEGHHRLSVLDVGPRTGAGSALLQHLHHPESFSRLKFDLTAIDIDPTYVAYANAHFPELNYRIGDIYELEERYDLVICSHTLEHVDDPRAFLRRLRALARQWVVVATPFGEKDLIPGHLHSLGWRFYAEEGARLTHVYRSLTWHQSMACVAAFEGLASAKPKKLAAGASAGHPAAPAVTGARAKEVAILGNCQAQILEVMLAAGAPEIRINRLKPNFEMTRDDEAATLETLDRSDVVLAQRVNEDHHLDWMRPTALRRRLGDRAVVWPNAYFDGVSPGVEYMYLPGGGKVVGPLDDYHFSQIAAAHRTGRTATEAVSAFCDDEIFAAAPDPVAASLARLRERERDCDIAISDVIEDEFAERKLFFTPNHPSNRLLGAMLARMATAGGLRIDLDRASSSPIQLDKIHISASPAIVRRLALPYDRETRHRGKAVEAPSPGEIRLGGSRDYTPIELVEAFYRVYDVVRA